MWLVAHFLLGQTCSPLVSNHCLTKNREQLRENSGARYLHEQDLKADPHRLTAPPNETAQHLNTLTMYSSHGWLNLLPIFWALLSLDSVTSQHLYICPVFKLLSTEENWLGLHFSLAFYVNGAWWINKKSQTVMHFVCGIFQPVSHTEEFYQNRVQTR